MLEQGRVAMTGAGAELPVNPHVKSAYLGIGEPAQDLFSEGSQP